MQSRSAFNCQRVLKKEQTERYFLYLFVAHLQFSGSSSRPETGLATSIRSSTLESRDLEERKRENESYRRLLAQPTFSLPPVIACE